MFNTGDTVFDLRHGWGVITSISTSIETKYPVNVAFNMKPESIQRYSTTGMYDIQNLYPTLFSKTQALQKFPEYPAPVNKQKIKKELHIYWNRHLKEFQTSYSPILSADVEFIERKEKIYEIEIK
jgi:hypothetical protein